MQTLFTFEYLFTLSYFYTFTYIALNTFILQQVAAQVLPTSSTETAKFCFIIDKLFDTCLECQEHNNLNTWIETTWSTYFDNR